MESCPSKMTLVVALVVLCISAGLSHPQNGQEVGQGARLDQSGGGAQFLGQYPPQGQPQQQQQILAQQQQFLTQQQQVGSGSSKQRMMVEEQQPGFMEQFKQRLDREQQGLYMQQQPQQQQRDDDLSKKGHHGHTSTTVCVEVRSNPSSPVTVCGPQIPQGHQNPLVVIPSSKDSIKLPQPMSMPMNPQQSMFIDRQVLFRQQPSMMSLQPSTVPINTVPGVLYQRQYVVARPQDGQLSMNCRVGGNIVDATNPALAYRFAGAGIPMPMQYRAGPLVDKKPEVLVNKVPATYHWNAVPKNSVVWNGAPIDENVLLGNQMIIDPLQQQQQFMIQPRIADDFAWQNIDDGSTMGVDQQWMRASSQGSGPTLNSGPTSPMGVDQQWMRASSQGSGPTLNSGPILSQDQVNQLQMDTMKRLQDSKRKLLELRTQLAALEDQTPAARATSQDEKQQAPSQMVMPAEDQVKSDTVPTPNNTSQQVPMRGPMGQTRPQQT